MSDKEPEKKPWFGNKRVGIGLRPQTWQGWLITILVTAVIVAVVVFARRGWR